ncbi:MAG TPA: hypothetical protein VFM33_07825 [Aquabacterium sp.]|nr:hypothetical protein [Aquabacterium sp.]
MNIAPHPLSAFPAFFDLVPRIRLYDPLAELLGSTQGGVLEYGYADAVRLAGHSCPTVASAYWMCVRALRELYPQSLPVRGNIQVSLRDPMDAGTTGVIASVVGLLTGAASSGGFKGIGGRFVRRDLLAFSVPIDTDLQFTRTDTGTSVRTQVRLQNVPADPRAMPLLARCLSGEASEAEQTEFGQLWQQRVQRILLDHATDDAVFSVISN